MVLALGMLASACGAEPEGRADAPLGGQVQAVRAGTDAAGLAPELRARVERDLSRAPDDLRVVARPDGLQQVFVQRGFRHATIAVAAPDGGTSQRCLTDAEEAVRLLEQGGE